METALKINAELVSILTTTIGWGAFIIVLLVVRNFVIVAFTRAVQALIVHGDEAMQRQIIKHLTDKDQLARDLYEEMKEKFSKEEQNAK